MAYADIDKVFEAEAIRDTSAHNSVSSFSGEFLAKTIVVENGLNQTVTCQLQGSADGSTWLNVGSTWDVSASTDGFQTVETYFPHYRLVAQCGTSPTSGVLDVCIIKARG